MNKRDIPVCQVSGEYVDCLERAFAPRGGLAVAASGGPNRHVEQTRGAMSNTPLSTSHLGRFSEDTAHLSVWVNWGLEEETLFARLHRCQLESQGRAEDFDPEAEAQEGEFIDFTDEKIEWSGEVASSAILPENYIEGHGDGLIEFGGQLWKVQPHGIGGRDNGKVYYKYVLKSKGMSLCFRRGCSETVSNVWIEIGSIPLAVYGGLENARNELWRLLEKEGIYVIRDIVSRVDLYADFDVCEVNDFCLRFHNHGRVTRARKESGYAGEEMNIAYHMICGRYTGFSIGRNIQLRCYDKRLEMSKDPIKWGIFAERYGGRIPDTLTRVEFQLRREALKDFEGPNGERIDDVDSYISIREHLWRYLTTDWFRLTDKIVDKKHNHHSRAKTWIMWEVVQNAAPSVTGEIRRVCRVKKVNFDQLKKMGMGCLMKAAVYELGNLLETPGDVVRFFRDTIAKYGVQYYRDVLDKHTTERLIRVGELLDVG